MYVWGMHYYISFFICESIDSYILPPVLISWASSESVLIFSKNQLFGSLIFYIALLILSCSAPGSPMTVSCTTPSSKFLPQFPMQYFYHSLCRADSWFATLHLLWSCSVALPFVYLAFLSSLVSAVPGIWETSAVTLNHKAIGSACCMDSFCFLFLPEPTGS